MDEAVKALRLANGYIDEIVNAVEPLDELTADKAPKVLENVARAMAQIDKAERLDGGAHYIRQTTEGQQVLTANELRGSALMYQGLTEALALGDLRSGSRTLEQAVECSPDFAPGHFALASIYADLGNKRGALRAAGRALDLDPENIEYEKLADRLNGSTASVSQAAGPIQKLARRKLFTSYVAAAVGLAIGLNFGVLQGLLGAYLLWATYWGVSVVWAPFWKFLRQYPILLFAGWLLVLLFFYIPLVAGYLYGSLGGGIYQFIKFRRLARIHA